MGSQNSKTQNAGKVYSINCETDAVIAIDIDDKNEVPEKEAIDDKYVVELVDEKPEKDSNSMISIVEIHEGEIPELEIDEEDQALMAKKDSEDAIMNLRLDSRELRLLNWFIMLAVQRIPRSAAKQFKLFLRGLQYLVLVAMFTYFLYNLGVFKTKTLEDEEWGLTITSLKNVLWNLRYPLFYLVGTVYFRKRHIERVLGQIRLTRRYWNHIRNKLLKHCIYIVLFTVVFPVALRACEMNIPTMTEKTFETRTVVISTVLAVLNRLLSLSVVFALLLVLYLLYAQARSYKENIQKWPDTDVARARDEFIDIIAMIDDFQKAFQALLVFYLGYMVVIFVPGIISWVEMWGATKYTHIYFTTPASSIISGGDNLSAGLGKWISLMNMTQHQKGGLPVILALPQMPFLGQPSSHRKVQQVEVGHEHKDVVIDYYKEIKVVLAAIIFSMELLALYSPLIIIGKTNNCIHSLKETISRLKFEEQRKGQFMFTSRRAKNEMLEDISIFTGIKLLGMELTTLKTVMITLAMPFLTMVFHVMFKHVDLTA
ncbi:uncharacterized protein LOC116618106 [Nematostella vectensis]|uniref:uncharacterized protein LOC116618106 n=1 Tax=Nematostella vectensis TaxID=45351 RepID=UPI002076E532|nr:uncharacterized protein LOC116618106 [Nematostella vectensis]